MRGPPTWPCRAPSSPPPAAAARRLDAAKPSFGELSVLTQLGEALGKGVWRSLMVVLTHANAARDKLGGEYSQVSFGVWGSRVERSGLSKHRQVRVPAS
jgi:hypothetical protein